MGTASIIELYLIFSLTTAIVGFIQIFAPVYRKIKVNHINNLITQSPIKANLLFVFFGFVAAPLLFGVLMVPSMNKRFADSMYDSLASPD